jgi:hypothetical protein
MQLDRVLVQSAAVDQFVMGASIIDRAGKERLVKPGVARPDMPEADALDALSAPGASARNSAQTPPRMYST